MGLRSMTAETQRGHIFSTAGDAGAVEQLGETEAERLFAEGVKLGLDEALERGRRLLVDVSSSSEPNSKEEEAGT